MPRFRTTTALILLLLLVLLAALSCGDDSPTTPEEEVDEEQILTIALETSSGSPGGRVAIDGIPEDVDFAYALVIVPGSTPTSGSAHAVAEGDTGFCMIRRTGNGDSLVVPLHPGVPMQGGSVRIEVTNGSNIRSNPVTLNIDPLPAAPGAFDAVVAKLENLIDAWAAQQNTTVAQMRSVPADQLTALETPLYLMHAIVSHPENDSSLRALADGDIPLEAGEVIDREVLDGVAAISGLGSFLDDKTAFVDTLTAPDTSTTQLLGGFRRSSSQFDCIEPPDFDIGPDQCWKLAEVMSYQSEIRLEKASAVEKLQDDAIDAATSALTYARGAIIAWGILNTIWVADNIETASTGIYPSDFLSEATDFTADPEEFPEDFTSPGRWSDFNVTAVSEGWRFDKVILDALKKAKGLGKSGWDDEKLQDFFDKAQKKTYQDYLDKVKKNVKNKAYNQAKQDLGIDDITKLEYCPQTWAGIDCTGLPYSSGNSDVLKYDSEDLSYEPVEVGSAKLLVETMPVFGAGIGTGETKIIETKRLEVFIDPFEATMDVKESKDFVARVANAEDQSVKWTIVGATKSDTPPKTTEVTTPNTPWEDPIALTAKSMTETGLREGKRDSDPRTKTVYIEYGGEVSITVTPKYKCISPDDTLRFEEHVSGLEEYTIIWKIVDGYGTIDDDGLYTALKTGTSYATISAEIEGVEGAIAYADVDVRECNCYFRIRIAAPASWNEEGADVAYGTSNFGTLIYTFYFEAYGPTGDNALSVSILDTDDKLAPRPGDPPGSWRVNLSYVNGALAWVSSVEDTVGGVYLDLDEITENAMEGTFSGTAVQYDLEGKVHSTAIVNIPFRAGHWDGSWPCN